jgi:hypothetical protein
VWISEVQWIRGLGQADKGAVEYVRRQIGSLEWCGLKVANLLSKKKLSGREELLDGTSTNSSLDACQVGALPALSLLGTVVANACG